MTLASAQLLMKYKMGSLFWLKVARSHLLTETTHLIRPYSSSALCKIAKVILFVHQCFQPRWAIHCLRATRGEVVLSVIVTVGINRWDLFIDRQWI